MLRRSALDIHMQNHVILLKVMAPRISASWPLASCNKRRAYHYWQARINPSFMAVSRILMRLLAALVLILVVLRSQYVAHAFTPSS